MYNVLIASPYIPRPEDRRFNPYPNEYYMTGTASYSALNYPSLSNEERILMDHEEAHRLARLNASAVMPPDIPLESGLGWKVEVPGGSPMFRNSTLNTKSMYNATDKRPLTATNSVVEEPSFDTIPPNSVDEGNTSIREAFKALDISKELREDTLRRLNIT